MADETGTPEPTPAATPAPEAPPPAPPIPATPSAEVLERTQPPSPMWQAMLERMGPTPEPGNEREPAPQAPRAPQTRAPAPTLGTPAARRYADQFETPEALEAGYREMVEARTRAETDRQRALESSERLERLLMSTWQQQQAQQRLGPDGREMPAPLPRDLEQALGVVNHELQLIAVADPQANLLRLVRAVAAASQADEATRRAYANTALQEYQQRADAQQQLTQLQGAFFEQYPDLKPARLDLLRQVAIATEDRLRAKRNDWGTPQFLKDWFAETAKEARIALRLGDGAQSGPAAPAGTGSARGQTAPGTPRPARGAAPFSESPGSRPSEPALSGQDAHLARVFGQFQR